MKYTNRIHNIHKKFIGAITISSLLFSLILPASVLAATSNKITTIAVDDLTPDKIIAGQTKVPLMTFTLKSSDTNEKLKGIKVQYTGDNKNDVSTLYLYRESTGSGGSFDPSTDIQMDSSTPPVGPPTEFNFNSLNFSMDQDTAYQFYIVADIASGATVGNKVDVKIAENKIDFQSGKWPNNTDEPLFNPAGYSEIASLPKLTVTKVVINDNGGTKTIADFPLFVGSTPVTSGVENTFPVGSYIVSEISSSGYLATFSGDCDVNGNITLNAGDVKSCTITNDDIAPKLKVTKIVKNDDGGTLDVDDFELFVNGTSVNSGEEKTFNAGTYTVSETPKPGYVGTIGGACNSDGSVTLNPGDKKECTITNDDIAPGLTVIKNVINDNGGTLNVGNFTLYINNTQVTSGQSNVLSAGTYVVKEDPVPGYTSIIKGDCDAQGNVTLNVGDTKVCTITNNDIPTSLTLNKVVINDNGGTANASAWILKAEGPVTLSGAGPTVSSTNFWAGTFTLSESGGPAGYNASGWICDGGSLDGNQLTLTLGQSATCTITNDDQPGTLIVKKVIINNNGGTKTFTDFSFSINGGEPVVFDEDGENELTVNAGVYNITEAAVNGYATTYDNCENVVITNGGSATCTITNDDIPGEIHGIKFNDLNGNGVKDEGEPGIAGWTINLSGPGEFETSTTTQEDGSYSFTELNIGTYTVTETLQNNWLQTTPNPMPIEIGLASIVNNVNFGNIFYQEKLGVKFTAPNGDFNSTTALTILEDSSVEVLLDGGTSTISLPRGTIITREDGSNIDFASLIAAPVTPGSLSGLGTGIVTAGALKWGLENLGLQFSQPITISIFVGNALNGQTLNVVRSVSGSGDWTNDGILPPATCLVSAGLCTFQATKASYYVATYTPPSTPPSSGGGGGVVLIFTTSTPPSTSTPTPTQQNQDLNIKPESTFSSSVSQEISTPKNQGLATTPKLTSPTIVSEETGTSIESSNNLLETQNRSEETIEESTGTEQTEEKNIENLSANPTPQLNFLSAAIGNVLNFSIDNRWLIISLIVIVVGALTYFIYRRLKRLN